MAGPSTNEPVRIHPIEQALVVLAAAACVFITTGIWRSVSTHQAMWPLPGLYFVEMAVLALALAFAFMARLGWATRLAWIASGIYAAFGVLGILSVGLFYIPIAIMFLLVAVLATVRQEQPWLVSLAAFVLAAITQAAFMFAAINLLRAAH